MQGGPYQAAIGFFRHRENDDFHSIFEVPQKALVDLCISLNQCAAKVHND